MMVTVSGIKAKQTIVSQRNLKFKKSLVWYQQQARLPQQVALSNRAAWKHWKISGAACGEHASEPCNLVKLTLVEE
jgi:hypothetical protein